MATNVTLRKKERTKNRESLYLDFYPPVTSPKSGKPTRREFLDLFVYTPIKILEKKTRSGNKQTEIFHLDPVENDLCILHNEKVLKQAKQLLSIRQNEFDKPEVYSEYEKEILRKKQEAKELENKSFLDYFIYLTNKRNGSNYSNWLSTLKHLQDFSSGSIRLGQLNQMYCEDFKDYLFSVKANTFNEKKLAQNTVFSYFNKFKAALKQAFKDGYLLYDLNSSVPSVKPAETHRNFLTIEELNQLAKTDCEVPVLRKAALFSALTGLRFVDIEKLTWRELEFIEGNGYFIKFTQKKTDGTEFMPISEQAYQILGSSKDPEEKVFEDLVYSDWLNGQLLIWVTKAGIKKKITFHSFRHTYAVLQLNSGTDIYTVSKMLGHRDLKTTQVYAKIVDATKREATNKIKLDL